MISIAKKKGKERCSAAFVPEVQRTRRARAVVSDIRARAPLLPKSKERYDIKPLHGAEFDLSKSKEQILQTESKEGKQTRKREPLTYLHLIKAKTEEEKKKR